MSKKVYSGIILFQAVILIIGYIFLCSHTYSPKSIINDMEPYGIEQRDDGTWYFDGSSGITYRKMFLCNSDKLLGMGSYTISVEYEAERNHSMEIYSGGDFLFSDGEIALGNGKNVKKTSFRATQDIDDFEVRFYYSGKGYLKINDVSLVRNNGVERENLLLIAIMIAVADLYFILFKRRSQFVTIYPVIAGMVTGIAISVSGCINEGASFLDTLSRECDGIGIDKMIVCIAVIYFYKKQWHLLYKIKSYAINGTSALFSVFMIIGISLSSNGSLIFLTKNFQQFIVSGLTFIGYYYLFRVLITFLFNGVSTNNSIRIFRVESLHMYLSGLAEAHSFLLASIVIAAGWLPYMIVFFPASVQCDGLVQVNAARGYTYRATHHPWILSEFMGLLMRIGQIISDNAGVFLIGMTFTTISVLCYGFACSRIKKYANALIYWISILFFAVIPAFPIFSYMVIKDGVHAALVVFFMTLYIDCCVKEGQNKSLSLKDYAKLGISAMLVCVTRKNGVYLVVPQLIFLVVWIKNKNRWIWVFLLSIGIWFGQVFSDSIIPEYFKIDKGSTGEMLSIPFQQTARYLLYAPEDITEEEREAIGEVLAVDYLADIYYPEISDTVKATYTMEDEKLLEYFKAWYSMLKKHPGIYIEATLEGGYGYFYPFRYSNESGIYFIGIEQEIATGDMYLHYLMPEKIRDIMKAYAELWINIPILSQIMNPGSYTWMLLLLAAYMIYRKRTKGVLVYIAPAMNILVCIASPVNGLIRYTLPLMACIPLMLGWCYFYCHDSA